MDEFAQLFEAYGYPALVLLGAAEFLGAPIAAAPALLVVGAASVGGLVHPVFAVGAIVAGALLGESAWFGLARWRGRRLVDMACGLASNPNLCALSLREKLRTHGARLLVVAKFVPGSGSLPAFAAGLGGFRFRHFLLADSFALVLWSTSYVLVGSVFHREVDAIVATLSERVQVVVWTVLGIMAVFALWRFRKARLHRGIHAEHAEAVRSSPPLQGTGEAPIIAPCRATHDLIEAAPRW